MRPGGGRPGVILFLLYRQILTKNYSLKGILSVFRRLPLLSAPVSELGPPLLGRFQLTAWGAMFRLFAFRQSEALQASARRAFQTIHDLRHEPSQGSWVDWSCFRVSRARISFFFQQLPSVTCTRSPSTWQISSGNAPVLSTIRVMSAMRTRVDRCSRDL